MTTTFLSKSKEPNILITIPESTVVSSVTRSIIQSIKVKLVVTGNVGQHFANQLFISGFII